jgi:SAM-dependent methyltransferase
MIAEARRLGVQHYEVGDAAHLPYDNGAFELVTLNNMIPFFDELARVTVAGGHLAVSYSMGASTPIWVPLERVRSELERRGFADVQTFSVGPGLSLLACKTRGR